MALQPVQSQSTPPEEIWVYVMILSRDNGDSISMKIHMQFKDVMSNTSEKVDTRTSSMQETLTKPQREEGLKGKNASVMFKVGLAICKFSPVLLMSSFKQDSGNIWEPCLFMSFCEHILLYSLRKRSSSWTSDI